MIQHSRPWLNSSDENVLYETFKSNMLSSGYKVREFEKKFSAFVGMTDGIAVNSGTSAQILALRAIGVKKGDEIILPTYVCKSVLEAVLALDAVPVICDIGVDGNMSYETVAPHINSRTKAIVLVHIFGIAVDKTFILKAGVPVIEDCCQSVGALFADGTMTGSAGVVSFFSFHATKCLTTGEGGMCLSNETELLRKMREIRDGNDTIFARRLPFVMTDLQASIGCNQLDRYAEFIKKRRIIADTYFSGMKSEYFLLPHSIRNKSMFFRFPVKIKNGVSYEKVQEYFFHKGIHVRRGVDHLLHRSLQKDDAQFPGATRAFNRTVSLPIYPSLTLEEQQKVIDAVNNFHGNIH